MEVLEILLTLHLALLGVSCDPSGTYMGAKKVTRGPTETFLGVGMVG